MYMCFRLINRLSSVPNAQSNANMSSGEQQIPHHAAEDVDSEFKEKIAGIVKRISGVRFMI